MDPDSEERRKPLVRFLQTAETIRAIRCKGGRHTGPVSAVSAASSIERFRRTSAGIFASTPCPEEFECWAGIHSERSIKADVEDTGFTARGSSDPLVATAEDVGIVDWTFSKDLADWTAGFAAGIGCCARKDDPIAFHGEVWHSTDRGKEECNDE